MRDSLTTFEERLILSAFPKGSQAVASTSFPGHGKRYPLRVTVTTPNGQQQTVVLRQEDKPGGSDFEAQLLPVLDRLGLPVPKVLAGPTFEPDKPGSNARIVFSLLQGTDLLRTCWDSTPTGLDDVVARVIEGIARVQSITNAIAKDPVAKLIPRRTLADEVHAIREAGGPWLKHAPFAEALKRVEPVAEQIETPLVFSSGDYNPGNFLTDGQSVTGFVDFAWACFEDPHVGITRFWLNDWYPLNKVGIVEKYLYHHDLARSDFAPRLVVRGLAMLQEAHAVEPKQPDPVRDATLERLTRSTRDLG